MAVSSSPPVRSRHERVKIEPSRLASMASSTIASTSAFRPASFADSVNRCLPLVTITGFSSGAATCCSILVRASSLVRPPRSTPATVTPSAIWSPLEESYTLRPTAPSRSSTISAAMAMNDL